MVKLMSTLINKRHISLGPHPATLVRSLAINIGITIEYHDTETKKKKEESIKFYSNAVVQVLDSTVRNTAGKSKLKTFQLFSNIALEDVGPLLSRRTRFPHLENVEVFIPQTYGLKTQRKNFQVFMMSWPNHMAWFDGVQIFSF